MKKFIALFLTVFMCAFMLIGCGKEEPIEPDYTKTPDTTSTENTTGKTPVEESTLGWDYEKIDFSGKKYVPSFTDADEAATKFGYRIGTYEYEYFKALSGISFYTMLADYYLDNRDQKGAYNFYDAYFEVVSPDEFISPYEAIMNHACLLLSEQDFGLASIPVQDFIAFLFTLPFECELEERFLMVGLSFNNNIDEKLTSYANTLLALSEQYPNYQGEFVLSDTAREAAVALIEACKPVAEKRETLRESWRTYYHANEPTMEVTEKFDAEHEAIKITITGNGRYKLFLDISGEYIENYQYEIVWDEEAGENSVYSLPMESPVVAYIPLHSYYFKNEFRVEKISEAGKKFDDSFTLNINPADYYSHEPLTLNNAFLDAALREYFGGDYSEADLLKIRGVDLIYKTIEGIPFVRFTTFRNESTVYEYPDLFDDEITLEVPEGTFDDFFHFKTLNYLNISAPGYDKGFPLPEELEEFLSRPDYQPTENTWDKPHEHDHS